MNKNHFTNISYEEAKSMIISKKDLLVIDVRTNYEYNKSHIRGSINIPLDKIEKEIGKVIKNKNKTLIVYCAVGVRSTTACQILCDLGYKNVYHIFGGINL